MKSLISLIILWTACTLNLTAQQNVTIEGRIKNFEKYIQESKHAEVYFHSLALGDEVMFIGKLNPDGSFKIAFPFYHAQDISFRYKSAIKLFVKPGDKLYMEYDADNIEKSAFTGDGADMNLAMLKYTIAQQKLAEEVYGSVQKKNQKLLSSKKDSTAASYKKSVYAMLAEDQTFYEKFIAENNVPDIFKEWAKLQLEYNYADKLLEYTSSAHKAIPEDYFDFFERFPLNNSQVAISSNFGEYIGDYNTYYFLKKNESGLTGSVSLSEIAKILLETDSITRAQKRKLIKLSLGEPSEKARLGDILRFLSLRKLFEQNEDLLNNKLQYKSFALIYDLYLDKTDGFMRDVLLSNMFYTIVEAKYLDGAKFYLDKFRQTVQTDYLENELLAYYKQEEEKIANYKLPAEAKIISLPKTEADSVWHVIVSKYKGKVVYVDFWATWCGPCREEMPASKLLREKLKGKEVVFVYLGVQSPEKSWKAVIAELDIQGENYLLKDNDYKILQSKFQINGIPRYMLLDKSGRMINDNAKGPSEAEKEILVLLNN